VVVEEEVGRTVWDGMGDIGMREVSVGVSTGYAWGHNGKYSGYIEGSATGDGGMGVVPLVFHVRQ
jgi:hypothetical protein